MPTTLKKERRLLTPSSNSAWFILDRLADIRLANRIRMILITTDAATNNMVSIARLVAALNPNLLTANIVCINESPAPVKPIIAIKRAQVEAVFKYCLASLSILILNKLSSELLVSNVMGFYRLKHALTYIGGINRKPKKKQGINKAQDSDNSHDHKMIFKCS
jgi:hypothetical protein